MRQIFAMILFIVAEIGIVAPAFLFVVGPLAESGPAAPALVVAFLLAVVAACVVLAMYVLLPIGVWAERADNRAWLKKRGFPYN